VRLRSRAILLLAALWLGASLSAAPARSAPDLEKCKDALGPDISIELQENDARIRREGNVKIHEGRSLYNGRNSYVRMLGAEFLKFLNTLRSGDRWIDIGAGPRARALLEYVRSQLGQQGKAKIVAVNVEPAPVDTSPEGQAFEANAKAAGLEVHADGRTIEQYKAGDIEEGKLVTDAVAAVTYSPNLAATLEASLMFVQPGGRFHSVMFKEWANEFCIRIIDQDGREVPLKTYLEAVRGAKVVFFQEMQISGGVYAQHFALERTALSIQAPPLELVSFKNASGKPGTRQVPQIVFRWRRGS
jgi:hypothetical protein